jgi:hypothetical protein
MGKEGIDEVKLPASIGLYRDVMSVNTARGGEGRSIKLGLEQNGKPEAEMEMETSMADDQESIEWEEETAGTSDQGFSRTPRSISCNDLVLFDLPGRNQVAFHMQVIRNYIHKT